jgi:integrase
MTIATAAARWWDEVGQYGAETDLGPFPSEQYPDRPLAWLVEQLGEKTQLDSIRDKDVAALVALRRKDDRSKTVDGVTVRRPISTKTVNRTVTKMLRRIMRKAVKSWNVEVHHMPDWSSHLLKEIRKPPRVITFAEQAQLAEFEREAVRAPREFALATGLRLAEVVTLTWPQVDLQGGVIRVIQKGSDPRTVAITPAIAAILRPLCGKHETAVFTYVAERTWKSRGFMRGQVYPLTYWALTTMRVRDFAKAGVKACWHDLRRTAAEDMRASGASLEDIRVFLGHKDIKTTEMYLGERSIADMRSVMQRRDAHVAEQRAQVAVQSADVINIGKRGRRK